MTLKLRKYRLADAADVVRMLNAGRAQPRAALDGTGSLRLARYVPAGASRAVAENASGHVLGYAYVADIGDRFIFETGGGVHPDFQDAHVGDMLIDWAEEEAKRLSEQAPPGVKCVLQANIFETERETLDRCAAHGFIETREWAHYDIHFYRAPAAPPLPNGLAIREFDIDSDDDWALVEPVLDLAFQDHWGAYTLPAVEGQGHSEEPPAGDLEPAPEDTSYSNAQGYCFIASIGGKTAGAVLCNARLVEFQDTGRVGSIFCHPGFRRRGVGSSLMRAAFSAFFENGKRRVILDTDSQSFTGSGKFYSELGMKIYRRAYLYEKEIRPGLEIRRLSR